MRGTRQQTYWCQRGREYGENRYYRYCKRTNCFDRLGPLCVHVHREGFWGDMVTGRDMAGVTRLRSDDYCTMYY
jgi:hypothetical protein